MSENQSKRIDAQGIRQRIARRLVEENVQDLHTPKSPEEMVGQQARAEAKK